jgi:NhaP-type Na+/H+ and K+/H+ antiporter
MEARKSSQDYIWAEDIYLQREKWQRWVLDAKIIRDNQAISLTGRTVGLRRNEMIFIMLVMRSWRFESLNESSRIIRERVWFGEIQNTNVK